MNSISAYNLKSLEDLLTRTQYESWLLEAVYDVVGSPVIEDWPDQIIYPASGEAPALAIDIDFSLPADRVVRSLDQIIEWRGKPVSIRSDNGPEYISGTLKSWAERHAIRLDFIQPGNPQQNAYIERYNRTVRYDWLSHYLFESIGEVQDYATRWMWTYNHERPHMALGGINPKQKLAFLTNSTSDPN